MSNANLFGEKISKPIKQLFTDKWIVTIGETKIKIGCKLYTIKQWNNFTDEKISSMDEQALKWWQKWKNPIMSICKETGRLED